MDKKFAVAFCLIDGIGAISAKRLISYCGSPEAVFRESRKNLIKIPGIGPGVSNLILGFKGWEEAEAECVFCEENGIEILLYSDRKYPGKLLQCDDGPVVLFTKGNTHLNPRRSLSIVGTRKATLRGKETTEKFVEAMVDRGINIVSGLAFGIDGQAHRSCVKNKVPTIGVMAHGLDKCYPQAHYNLSREMMTLGGLVSEIPSGKKLSPENFPMRNRIVAGMSDATLVVESDGKGGSLITANLAFDYNREVFAIPGRPEDRYARGCHGLIRSQRATLITDPEQLLKDLGWLTEDQPAPVQTTLFHDLSETEEVIAEFMKNKGKLTIDELCVQLNESASTLSSNLLSLEFKGLIRALPGKVYERI